MGGRTWAKPELIVLARTDGAENVMTICKTAVDWPSGGPALGYSACFDWDYCYPPGCATHVMS